MHYPCCTYQWHPTQGFRMPFAKGKPTSFDKLLDRFDKYVMLKKKQKQNNAQERKWSPPRCQPDR